MPLLILRNPKIVHENNVCAYYLLPIGVTVRVSKQQKLMFCEECCRIHCIHTKDIETWLAEETKQ